MIMNFYFYAVTKSFPTEIIAGIATSATFVLIIFVALGVWFVAKRRFSQNNPNSILYASVNPEYISVGKLDGMFINSSNLTLMILLI